MGVRISHAWHGDHLVAADTLTQTGLMPDLFCPGCRDALIARRATEKRRAHFAHQRELEETIGEEPRCHLRTISARMGGYFLRERLRRSLGTNRNAEIVWTCRECGGRHEQDLLRGVQVLDVEGLGGEPALIGLYGDKVEQKERRLLGVVQVSFERAEDFLPAAVELVRGQGAVLWMVTASSQEAAAQLGREAGALEAVQVFQAPCLYEARPTPLQRPPTPPRSAVLEWPSPPRAARAPLEPVLRTEGEPVTFPLPKDRDESGSCLHCRRPLARRHLYLHPLETAGPGGKPATMGLVIYQAGTWRGAGWEEMSETERATARQWGADPNVETLPPRLANLAEAAVRYGREVLGSYSCWCPSCKILIETLP